MADPKRKLPVIPEYVFLSIADGRFGKYWETTIADGKEPEFWPGTHAVRFEPAVPRCRTCGYFDGKAYCLLLQQSDGRNNRCVTGDDYCSEHPEATNA